MSRRTLSSAALAAALLTSGLTPLLGTAHADNCASWSDNGGDTRPMVLPAGLLPAGGSDNLDIVKTSVQTIGDKIVATLQLKNLSETGYDAPGDAFAVQMTFAGTVVAFNVYRSEAGITANVKGAGTGAATYAITTNAIAISTTQAELDKAAGKPTKDVEATNLAATTSLQGNGSPFVSYDDSAAPAGTTYKAGAQCSPVVLPPAGLKFPTPNCKTFGDDANDAKPRVNGGVTLPAVNQQVGNNDPTLDITEVAVNTTPAQIQAFIKVPQLAEKPNNNGDRFEFNFAVMDGTTVRPYRFSVGRLGTGGRVFGSPTYGAKGGVIKETLKVGGTFDVARKTVVVVIDRAALDETNAMNSEPPIANGVKLFNVTVRSLAITPIDLVNRDAGLEHDLVADSDTAKRVYTVGESPCFEPAVSKLTNLGPATVQFGDVLDVSAKLTSSSDQAFADRPVKFTLGSVSTTATTNAEGVASTKITPTATAGTHNLVISFAGDQDTKPSTVTKQVTVAPEVSSIALTVKKSGTKRTVTAKLTDDDGKALAGQVVTWFVNGKRISAPKTNSGGIVTISTAKAGQTVKAVFAGVADKYAGSDAQEKLT